MNKPSASVARASTFVFDQEPPRFSPSRVSEVSLDPCQRIRICARSPKTCSYLQKRDAFGPALSWRFFNPFGRVRRPGIVDLHAAPLRGSFRAASKGFCC